MSDRPQNIRHRSIGEQAADWLVRLRAGSLSSGDRHEYVHWLKRSPAHIRAVLELASLEYLLRSADLTGIPPPPRDSFGMPQGISRVVELRNPRLNGFAPKRSLTTHRHRR